MDSSHNAFITRRLIGSNRSFDLLGDGTSGTSATEDLRRYHVSERSDILPPPKPPVIGEVPALVLPQPPPTLVWQIPTVVYTRAVYEPVAHDHPPLADIRALIAADRRRRRRGRAQYSEDSSSVDDSDTVYDY